METCVVYHLVAKTGWSKVALNGTHQNTEWKFPWDVPVPFPRTFPQGRIQAERPRTSSKSKRNAHFPFGNSVWEFWTTFQEILFSPETPK